MPGYDPSAANEYNQLIQQGLDPEEAAVLAGISLQDLGNYSEVNGLLTENEGPPTRDTDVGPQTDYGTTYDAFGSVVPIAPPTQDTPVNPSSDPSQFPAYDDEGNLLPGFAINPETGETYYRGITPPTQQTAGFDPNFDEFAGLDAAIAAQQASGFDPYYDEFAGLDAAIAQQQNAVPVDNPYYGLTPEQIQKLGGADPTDPYIRARLGIPQLPGSPIAATPGFGTIKTGIPLVDNALSFLGGLFGSSTPSTKSAATSPAASSSAALGNTPPPTPAVTPPTQDTAVSPAIDPSQFPAYDDEGNLLPGYAVNSETGEPYYQGFDRTTSNVTTLNDQETAALFEGTDNPTPAQVAAVDAQTAADAAILYPGTDNTNLREINAASAAIAQNEAGIANAQNIIAQNNAELADPNISDARRAELVANNASQENYIRLAESNTAENELVIEANADAFAAGGGEPNSGQAAPTVDAATDTGVITPLTDAETAGLFGPPETAPVLLTDEQIAAIYPPTNPQEVGALNGTTIISDEARAALSDPAAIAEQLALNAAPPPPPIDVTSVPLTDEETAALFAEEEASQPEEDAPADVSPEEDPELPQPEDQPLVDTLAAEEVDPATDTGVIEPLADEESAALFAEEVDPATDTGVIEPLADEEAEALFAEEVDPAVDEELQEPPGAEPEFTELAEPVDPDADPELLGGPDEEVDPFAPLEEPPDVDANEDPELLGGPDEEVDPFAPLEEPPDVDANEDPELLGGPDEEEPGEPELLGGPDDVDPNEDQQLADQQEGDDGADPLGDADTVEANNLAAMKIRAQSQATLQSRFKTPGDQDWRVRIQLSPNSDYLYNDVNPGILAPLRATNGVLFPYVPQITTNYTANYEQYDLTHSNYRGIFYKNSKVGDIQVRGTFTAQDTKEAEYLLAVIHFFRSVTKMFYGQDWQRGTPPPMVFLSGFGNFQFNGHPCVVNTFNYTLPNDVDYIRATNFNNYGTNLFNRRSAPQSSPGGINAAGAIRLANALLPKGALPNIPAAGPVNGTVTNTQSSTYVPTKLEIDITLIPVQTRSQVSKQFSMQEFANGNLIRGGFW